MQSIVDIKDISYPLFSYLKPNDVIQLPLVCKLWKDIIENSNFYQLYASNLSVNDTREISILSFKKFMPFLTLEHLYGLNYTRTQLDKIPEEKTVQLNLQATKFITTLRTFSSFYGINSEKSLCHLDDLNTIFKKHELSNLSKRKNIQKKTFKLIKIRKIEKKLSEEDKTKNLLFKDLQALASNSETIISILKREFSSSKIFFDSEFPLFLCDVLFKAFCESMKTQTSQLKTQTKISLCIQNEGQLNIFEEVFGKSEIINAITKYNLQIHPGTSFFEKNPERILLLMDALQHIENAIPPPVFLRSPKILQTREDNQ